MHIRTVIDGKEIKGYWNGKFYRSNREGFARIYINGKEYTIRKDSFTYEEILTEKQQKYAESLKNEFLKELEASQVDKEIVEYFGKKPAEFFLRKGKHKLRRILGHLKIKLYQHYFKELFINNRNIYELQKEFHPENRPSEKELIRAFKVAITYCLEDSILKPFPDEMYVMLADDGFYYFQTGWYITIKVDVQKGTYQPLNNPDFADYAEQNLNFKWEAEFYLKKINPFQEEKK